MFGKPLRKVVALHNGGDISYSALVSSDGAHHYIENIERYSEDHPGGELFKKDDKVSYAALALGEEQGSFFTISEGTSFITEDNAKLKAGITPAHIYDDFSVRNCKLFSFMKKEDVVINTKMLNDIFPTISETNYLIGNTLLSLVWGYLRNYSPAHNERTALIYTNSEVLSIVVLHGEQPIWTVTISLTDEFDKIVKFTKESLHKELHSLLQGNCPMFSRIIFTGEFDQDDVNSLNNKIPMVDTAELFQFNLSKSFHFRGLNSDKRQELIKHGHKFVTAIYTASMLLEQTGVNLSISENNIKLIKEYDHERLTLPSNDFFSKSVDVFMLYGPLVMGQHVILAVTLCLALLTGGYRYWSTYSTVKQLDSQIAVETAHAQSLADVRVKAQLYQAKIDTINQNLKALDEISKNQLVVRTALNEIDSRVPAGLVFREVFVDGRNVHIRGYAPDRGAAIQFASRLGSLVSTFSGVVPLYDDKSDKGDFEINCQFIREVQQNNLPIANTVKTGFNQ